MSVGKNTIQTEEFREIRLTCGSSHLHHTKTLSEKYGINGMSVTLHNVEKDKVTVWCSTCGATIWTNVV